MADEPFQAMWMEGDRARHPVRRPGDVVEQLWTLTQRNYELTTLVSTLVDLLAQSGAVDPHVLLAVVEGKLETEVKVPMPAPPKVVPMTRCAKCATEVPMADAEMTTHGLMCGRCAMTAPPG